MREKCFLIYLLHKFLQITTNAFPHASFVVDTFSCVIANHDLLSSLEIDLSLLEPFQITTRHANDH